MRQRVLIAAAFAAEPELIVADEPTTALDVTVQRQVLKMIAALQARHGTTMLFVTHDLGVVARVCQSVSVPLRRAGGRGGSGRADPDRARACLHPRAARGDAAAHRPRRPRCARCRRRCWLAWTGRSRRPTPPGVRMPEPRAEPLIAVEGLRVAFPGPRGRPVEVLHGIDLAVARGEILGIVGESGSGKTTLGRAILRLVEPASGRIRFDGHDVTHLGEAALRPLRTRMQMIFQDPLSSLNPRRTALSLVATPLRARREPRAEARAAEALERVGLAAPLHGRYPHQLSGGQRQRIGIARAIAQGPDFILADEIASGLDVSSQAQVLALLQALVAETGTTLAFVSHDLAVVRRLCDRVVVMREGRIVEEAATAALFAAPRTAYARELIDAIPLPQVDQAW